MKKEKHDIKCIRDIDYVMVTFWYIGLICLLTSALSVRVTDIS